jgi:hypothetical protein
MKAKTTAVLIKYSGPGQAPLKNGSWPAKKKSNHTGIFAGVHQ